MLPLVDRTAKPLSAWLSPAWGERLELRADLDRIEALSPEREALWARLEKVSFLTPNEKRAAIGYAPLGEAGSDALRPTAAREPKFNPHHDDLGRFTFKPEGEGAETDAAPVGRRRGSRLQGAPAQEMRLSLAEGRAREATRQVRELEPDWKAPSSLTDPYSIEGEIAKLEATAQAAEARLAEILKDAIPGTNPSWGVNRLTKELYDRGFVLSGPTRSPGLLYENPATGEQVRIMERPPFRYPSDPPEKFTFEHYYRYRPGKGEPGSHVPIPDKN